MESGTTRSKSSTTVACADSKEVQVAGTPVQPAPRNRHRQRVPRQTVRFMSMAFPRCPYCRESFEPSRYHPDQIVRNGPTCQRRRRVDYHRQKVDNDPSTGTSPATARRNGASEYMHGQPKVILAAGLPGVCSVPVVAPCRRQYQQPPVRARLGSPRGVSPDTGSRGGRDSALHLPALHGRPSRRRADRRTPEPRTYPHGNHTRDLGTHRCTAFDAASATGRIVLFCLAG